MVTEANHPSTPRRSRSESVDPLLLFTPSRPSLHDENAGASTSKVVDDVHRASSQPPSSPLTPPPAERHAAPHRESPDSPVSPRRPASPPTHPDDFGIAVVLANNPRRYSFRDRNAKQLNPYKVDKVQYQNQLRDHPDAIVKFRSPRRHHNREEDYKDVQTQEPQELGDHESENDNREEQRDPKPSGSKGSYPNLLPALPSTDEEDGDMDAVRKEARRLRREQRKREAKGKPGRKIVKPFPLRPNDDSDADRRAPHTSPSRRTDDRMHSPDSATGRASQKPSSRHRRHRTSGSPTFPADLRTSAPPPLTPVFHDARSVSPSGFFPDNDDVDMEMPGNFSPPHSPHLQRNDPGTPIVISDDESDRAPSKTAEESEPEELSKKEKQRRRRIRALNRMYPAFMRERMMEGAPPKATIRHQRSPELSSASDEEEPLLPGQTRVRRAEHPRDLRNIKGDTESSDDPMVGTKDAMDSNEGPAASDSDVEVVWHRRQHRVRDDIWSSSDEEVLSDGRIDDERIEAYLKEAPVRGSGLQEKDMIDWMLANTAQVGGTRRSSTRVRSNKSARTKGSTRPKYSVTIGGARRERQTLLSFDKPPDRGRSRGRRRDHSPQLHAEVAGSPPRDGRKRAAVRQTAVLVDPSTQTRSRPRRVRSSYSSPERRSVDDVRMVDTPPFPLFRDTRIEIVHHIPDPEVQRKAAKKQKEKDKLARVKQQGIYFLPAPKGSRIVGQRSKTVAINVADRGFHRALAPITSNKSPQLERLPNSNLLRAQIKPTPASPEVSVKRRFLPRGNRPHITVPDAELEPQAQTGEESDDDANTPDVEEQSLLLDFGIPLDPKVTLDSESMTYLSALLKTPVEVVRPGFYSAHGFDLNPNISTPEFLDIFGNLCDRFFEFATGLPEEDNGEQVKEWKGLIKTICLLVTYLGGGESETLKTAVETQILCLTSKMRQACLTSISMDSTTFAICWFAVDLAVRAGFRLPEKAFQEACTVLVEHLLEYGLERGLAPLTFKDEIHDPTTHRAFEAWIGLWHIAHKCRENAESKSPNPLWKMVETALSRQPPKTSDLETSEQAWRAIIGLSTLSQFSELGKHLNSSTILPAPWEMVVFALKRIRFQASDEIDRTMSDSSLDNRDRYVKLIVERCCLLWSRWKWGLDNASIALSRLIEIFQSRKFTNLRHEKSEFPDFLRVNDWTLLSRPIHSETTFVLFLKLVYQTLLVDPSKAKKLLSLAAPVGSLPWSKQHPPSLHDLSQLFNRFSAMGIAIHFDPDHHSRWLQLARGCVKFKDVDATTRNAHIRGLMYLSTVMVQRNIQLDASLSWLDEMVAVLLDEHKRQTGPTVVLGIHALVVSVRNVIRAFKGTQRYPDPRLLLSLERILRDSTLVKPTNASAHIVPRLIRSFLAGRTLAVPEPRRPIIPDQESQDEYAAFAFDQDIIAALDQEDQPDYKIKDCSLCKLLDENIIWTLFRQLVEYVKVPDLKKSFKTNGRVSTDIVSLTGCWVGCGDIVIQNSAKSWSTFLHAYGTDNSNWPVLDSFCQRRMDLLVFSNVLKLDPMSYLTLQETFLVVLFESFASWHTTSEDDYIKLLLSIDGLQHPLLRSILWDPDMQKDAASNIEILTARIPLLTAILENLDHCLSEAVDAEGNKKYVGYTIKMFSAMKNVHMELDKTKAAQQSYASWCSQVFREYQNHPIIAGEDRLRQWMTWGERLNDNV
ncbi:Mus7/MMS22 family-domain-containing protein [Mycena capillaripes]|nr:Mus7/MMS22 family-domain-containing protein [Mycena capillaripes]